MNNKHWTNNEVSKLYEKPFFELVQQAYVCHKASFDLKEIEFCMLSSIKTGNCPEDCAYCPQSGHYKTTVKKEKLLGIDQVLMQAQQAKKNGVKRFCMGAAWRSPAEKDFKNVLEMVKVVKSLGLEVCATLGLLNKDQADRLKAAGLDFYNHNLDTSASYYNTIITSRNYEDRITTLSNVIAAGLKVCCGGILGMGETRNDRIELLLALNALPSIPQSIPINQLLAIAGTPLENQKPLDNFEFIKTIAVARIMFPKSKIRLAAGRENMSDEMQAWCFMAGANSIFIGEKLLTAKNSDHKKDIQLLKKLSIMPPEKLSD